MTTAISVAQGALALTGKQLDESNWEGRRTTHWSVHVTMAGTLIGAIVLLVGIAIDSIALSILGGFILITNGLSSYYLKKFSVFHAVDEVIRALSETIKELYEQVLSLHLQIQAIKPAADRIALERKQIEERLKESQATIAKLKGVGKDYQKVAAELKHITAFYNPLKTSIDTFVAQVGELRENQIDFGKLSAAIKDLAHQQTQIESSIKTLGDESTKLTVHERGVAFQIEKLAGVIDQWNGRYNDLLTQNAKLEREVNELRVQMAAFDVENQRAEKLVNRIEKLRDAIPNQEALKAMIEELKKMK